MSSRRLFVDKDDPSNLEETIDIPVIDEITFIDGMRQNQEFRFKFDNSDQADRKVHILTFGDPTDPQPKDLRVEEIEEFKIIDNFERGQDYLYKFLFDDSENPPEHLKFHDVKVMTKHPLIDPDTGEKMGPTRVIVLRRIDQLLVLDGRELGQETIFKLDWDDDKDLDTPPPPDTSWDNSSINPPWRFDPFQIILAINTVSTLKLTESGGGGLDYTDGEEFDPALGDAVDDPADDEDETKNADEFLVSVYPERKIIIVDKGDSPPKRAGEVKDHKFDAGYDEDDPEVLGPSWSITRVTDDIYTHIKKYKS